MWTIIFLAVFICAVIGFVKLFSKLSPPLQKPLLDFWSYKEMRWMVATCGVIYFALLILPAKIEIEISHTGSTTINHDFGGNGHKPINLQFSDPGYPIKVEIRNK